MTVHWESRDAEGEAVAIDPRTRTVRNIDGTTRHLDRIYICCHTAELYALPEEEITAAPHR